MYDILTEIKHRLSALESGQASALAVLRALFREVTKMSVELDALATQIAKNTTVIGSALVLIQGFSARLDAAMQGADAATRAKLQALKDEVDARDEQGVGPACVV